MCSNIHSSPKDFINKYHQWIVILNLLQNKRCKYISQTKSLYRSRAGRHFYGTENEIWAGFGPVGNTEKKWGADYGQILRVVFPCFKRPKNNLKSF